MTRDYDDLLKRIKRANWRYRKCGSGHIMVYPPTGPPVTIATSPSDRRAFQNAAARLRNRGLP